MAPDRWVLKGAFVLDFRLAITTRSTKDIDLGRDDDEQAAIRDITAALQSGLTSIRYGSYIDRLWVRFRVTLCALAVAA